jgi:hypothetical protein
MLQIKGTAIYLTRGDTARIQLTLSDDNGEYTPASGDRIRFAMKRRMSDSYAILTEIEIPTDTLVLQIDPEHTQALPYSKTRPYKYDIEVTSASGSVDTVIADADFYIMPEVDVYES